jgi:hypothetical protein
MADPKLLTDIEIATGFVVRNPKDMPKIKDEAEFIAYAKQNLHLFTGVMYDDRIKFLKDNDYELTRENLIDPELSAKPKPEPKSKKK